MPTSEKLAHGRGKANSKYKAKNRVGRCVELLMFGLLIAVTGDSTLTMINCIKNCYVKLCLAADVKELTMQAPVKPNAPMVKHCVVPKPRKIPEWKNLFNYKYPIPTENPTHEMYNNMTMQEFLGIGVSDDFQIYADPTRNRDLMYGNEAVLIDLLLRDIAIYTDKFLEDILTSELAERERALIGSAILAASF